MKKSFTNLKALFKSTIYFYFLILFSLTVTISCEEDILEEKAQGISTNSEITVINGRMYFPNKEVFVETFSGGAGQLVLPKSMKVKMYGVAKRNGAWHGSKIEVGLD